jgi:hypothetical protein
VKEKVIPLLISWLLRLLGLTLRFRLEDRSGLRDERIKHPVIWAFWHNRMLMVPVIYNWFYKKRQGSVLTSASKDGAIIAGVMHRFGIGAVRGSSSRRGSTAIRELAAEVERGGDVAITPDGPRGPRYTLGPGIIFLAQLTGVPVVPIRIEYSRAVRLKSWDAFMIPLPFTRVDIVFDELFPIAPDADIETERARLEQHMQPNTP